MSLLQEIQVGNKGLLIRVPVLDQAGAPIPLDAPPVFHFEDEKGVDHQVNGVIDDQLAHVAVYKLSQGDGIAEDAGTWKVQVYFELSSGFAGFTKPGAFVVLHNLGG